MSPADDLDALLERLAGRTAWLATGTVLRARVAGSQLQLVVQLDGAEDPVVTYPVTEEPLGTGAHVLCEYLSAPDPRRRIVCHGSVPVDVVFPVGDP